MSVTDRKAIQTFAAIWATVLVELIQKYVALPEVTVPNLSVHTAHAHPLQTAEAASQAMRSLYGMSNSPLRSAIDLAESLGILVFWADGPREFDAVSFWIEGRPFIILNRNMNDGYRMRFTVLHEIFHICAHKDVQETGKNEDRQADAFASAMLMPASTYRNAFNHSMDIYSILEDRRIWGASARSQVRRAFDIGLISEWQYRDAFIKMNCEWGRLEPVPISVEESAIHNFFFNEAGDRGRFAADLAEEANLSYLDFLTGMPKAREFERIHFMNQSFA